MFVCLFIAILATIIWVNLLISEVINSKINPYTDINETDKKRAIIINYLAAIMALFWAIVLRYW